MPHRSEELMARGNTAVGMKTKSGIFPNAFFTGAESPGLCQIFKRPLKKIRGNVCFLL